MATPNKMRKNNYSIYNTKSHHLDTKTIIFFFFLYIPNGSVFTGDRHIQKGCIIRLSDELYDPNNDVLSRGVPGLRGFRFRSFV